MIEITRKLFSVGYFQGGLMLIWSGEYRDVGLIGNRKKMASSVCSILFHDHVDEL